jgi:hypothetical protein
MPKGPNGEKRPSDVIGAAVLVGKIATGEVEEIPAFKSGRVKSGRAGGSARAEKMSPERRSEVARGAASARWQRNTESAMDEKKIEIGGRHEDENLALMYPTNQLGDQVRGYDATEGVGALFRRELFDKK